MHFKIRKYKGSFTRCGSGSDFFAATIGLHCNKWSYSHCVAAAAAAAKVLQGAASEWVPTPFYAVAAAAKRAVTVTFN